MIENVLAEKCKVQKSESRTSFYTKVTSRVDKVTAEHSFTCSISFTEVGQLMSFNVGKAAG